jgi:hypothetical protein
MNSFRLTSSFILTENTALKTHFISPLIFIIYSENTAVTMNCMIDETVTMLCHLKCSHSLNHYQYGSVAEFYGDSREPGFTGLEVTKLLAYIFQTILTNTQNSILIYIKSIQE